MRMSFKTLITVFITSFFLFSCAQDTDTTVPRNLQEYITTVTTNNLAEVTAFAANANGNKSLTYIYYYPEDGATDIRYYEADSLQVDQNNFVNYRRKPLTTQAVFGGKMQRFSRSGATENWCIVTYVLNGELQKSNPIRLKNATSSTLWTNEVSIQYPKTLEPNFTWSNFMVTDNAFYFQVITENEQNTFISGTYTNDQFFQYFDTSNVIKNFNIPETPSSLKADTEYLFTTMGISEDNWVNTIIQKTFIPRNLEEYLQSNATKTKDVATAFAASNSASQNITYIYYNTLVGATDFRYYETDSLQVNNNDFSNYRRKNLTDQSVFGGKFKRYSRNSDIETWCIVTFIVGETLYKSNPIKINNKTNPTEWLIEVSKDFTQSLQPKFTWEDGKNSGNTSYFQVLTDIDDVFFSGTFTTQKAFTYYNDANVIATIHTQTPPDLVLNNEYKITVMGLTDDNWVNLVIQDSFISQ